MRHVLEGVVKDPQDIVSERVGEVTFQFKAGEFFQNNPYILPDLVEHVAKEASAEGARYPRRCLLWCGALCTLHCKIF